MTVTSRHFKAHQSLVSYTEAALDGLEKYYDGIIKSEAVLSYERSRNSTKTAELNIHVYNAMLSAKFVSEDFYKSVDGAADKVLRQLKRYKEKLRKRDRQNLRRVREKI